MAVNVTRKYRGERGRDVAKSNDVVRGGEREIRRTYGRAFDAVVHAENTEGRGVGAPSRVAEQCREPAAHGVSLVREAGKSDCLSAKIDREGARPIEHAHVWMEGEARVRNSRSLVVAGHNENRDSAIGDLAKRLERLIADARHGSRSVEDVAAVNHDVDLAAHRGLEGGVIIRQKVVAPTVPTHSWTDRQVESDVRIGEEQDANVASHGAIVTLSVFVR